MAGSPGQVIAAGKQEPPCARGRTPHSGPEAHHAGFRADIEGLRGIAVLLVVLFHARIPGFRGGFTGVDVFFVLSGYLITGLLVAEVRTSGQIDLTRFYARRARRLLPAAALTVCTVMALGFCLMAPQELEMLGRTALATSLYASNIFFAVNEADYFAASVETNPLLHTWSLAVEEQFYLVWPFLIMLGLQRSFRALLWLMSGLTAASLSLSVWQTLSMPNWAFYASPARAWEFGIGGLAAMIPAGTAARTWRGVQAGGWLGLAGIVGSGVWITRQMGFPGWIAMAPALSTAVALVAGSVPGRGESGVSWGWRHSSGWGSTPTRGICGTGRPSSWPGSYSRRLAWLDMARLCWLPWAWPRWLTRRWKIRSGSARR
jgi:peptidoglycan/LPS O-acetylase OafA/YrhL